MNRWKTQVATRHRCWGTLEAQRTQRKMLIDEVDEVKIDGPAAPQAANRGAT